MIPQDTFDSDVPIRLTRSCRYSIMADFAGEHSSPLRNTHKMKFETIFRQIRSSYILSLSTIYMHKQCPALRCKITHTFCFACMSLQNTHLQNFNHNCQDEDSFFIRFHHPYHYNANRQRKTFSPPIFL